VYEERWWSEKLKAPTVAAARGATPTPAAPPKIEATPVIKDGVAVVVASDKVVRALDLESGKQKWNATMKGSVVGTPAISDKTLFVVDSLGNLESRLLQTGDLLATAAVGPTKASIMVHEGKVFVGNEAGEMKAYSEDLTLLWKFAISSVGESKSTTGTGTSAKTVCDAKFSATGSQIRGAPAIYADKVIFGSLNHWVFALNEQGDTAQATELKWMFKTGDAVFGSPTVDDVLKRVIVGSYDEKVYALPASPSGEGPIEVDGKPCTGFKNTPNWTFIVPSDVGLSKVESTPAIDGDNAYFGANNGRVYAVTLSGGTKVWEFVTGGDVTSSPALSNGILVVGSDDGKVYWLKASDGTKLNEFLADSSIKSSPALDGNRAVVASFEGSVYMFGPKKPTKPDLLVTAITYEAGGISVTVKNAGDGEAAASSLRLTVDGALAADVPVGVLAAGASTTVIHNMALAAGSHVVAAQADQASVLQEHNENNNGLSKSVAAGQPTATNGGGGDKGGFKIPAAGLAPTVAVLALALLALRRRR
ncbi:MAG: eukaryotic-like serine/threonine-protein kinase, partial [Thermoplasmata archaeon]|nr:eukaryotic-like serine/threonine-protein kinase [Thermoplasmata archaeon]